MRQGVLQTPVVADPVLSIETGISRAEWSQLRMVWAAVGVAMALTFVSPVFAGLWYATISCWVALTRPQVGLALILAGIPLTYNVSPGVVNLSLAEVALVFTGSRALLTGRPRLMPVVLPIAAYLLICVLSSAIYFRGNAAAVSFVQMLVYLVLATATFSAYGGKARPVITALVALVGASTVLALIMLVAGQRGYLFGIHKNSIGATTATSLVIAVELYFRSKVAKENVWTKRWLVVVLVLAAGLFLSFSRGAWASAVIAIIIIAVLRRRWRLLVQVGAAIIPIALIGYFFVSDQLQQYIVGSVDTSTHSFQTRRHNADIAMSYFQQSPLIGSGLGLRKQNDATNIVLFTIAETGVLGLAAFVSIHVVAIYTVMKKRVRVDVRSPGFTVLVLAAALLLGRFAHGLVDHYWSRGAITAVWALVGAALTIQGFSKQQVNEQSI